jgi:Mg2+/Co2+ transporter CorB
MSENLEDIIEEIICEIEDENNCVLDEFSAYDIICYFLEKYNRKVINVVKSFELEQY